MSREVSQPTKTVMHHKDDLLNIFTGGARAAKNYKIGIEFERFVLDPDNGQSLPFSGSEKSIESLLKAFQKQTGWEPIYDDGALISLVGSGAAITLEPGGQLEISGNAHQSLKDAQEELQTLVTIFDDIGSRLGLFYARTAVPPVTPLEDTRWVPKSRYAFMRKFHKGDQAFYEMMGMTAAIQVNFDYSSEQDCARKIKHSSFLSPILAALFANSFYEKGSSTAYKTRRMSIWNRLDPVRSGIKSFFVDGTFTFERYRDYMMDVPMYFISREGVYEDVGHCTFRNYMREKPYGDVLEQDWLLHLTTTFPEVRLKDHLEIRSIDSNPLDLVMACGALVKGLLYSEENLDHLDTLFGAMTFEDVTRALEDVAKQGMHMQYAGKAMKTYVEKILEWARQGLDHSEGAFLDALAPYVAQGVSPAEMKLKTMQADDADVWKTF